MNILACMTGLLNSNTTLSFKHTTFTTLNFLNANAMTEKWWITWFISMVWMASPRVKTIAWFWFSGFPSPSLGSPGSLIEKISYRKSETYWVLYIITQIRKTRTIGPKPLFVFRAFQQPKPFRQINHCKPQQKYHVPDLFRECQLLLA